MIESDSDSEYEDAHSFENVQLTQSIENINENPSSRALELYRENPIRDVCILNKNFDLSSMPTNYMRRRSKIEEVIYRAVYSQNSHKSPFASFKTARDFSNDLDKIDVITGINSLKKVIKSAYDQSEQVSIVVHNVAGTILLDEFDINDLIIRNHHYADWEWLRDFIKQQQFQVAKPNLSRSNLTARDLYAKFLYHSVSQQPSIAMSPELELQSAGPLSLSPNQARASGPNSSTTAAAGSAPGSSSGSGSNAGNVHKEDFLNLIDWRLEDLSFVVGSDLSIFGTKSHPCISLRLNPASQEPISILTGIDIWLENLLNEVPEVAMCYHSEGIVMRDYDIVRTADLPELAGFRETEVRSIARNLVHFLSANTTKEGHTYWLFKETDSTTVKLYDLTDLWKQQQQPPKDTADSAVRDSNPFILPVALLCYKLAENRIAQWYKARRSTDNCNSNSSTKMRLSSSQHNEDLCRRRLADNEYYFSEIFRLLRNCVNLLQKQTRHPELMRRAMMLMCRLYLEVDQTTLLSLARHPPPPASEGNPGLADVAPPTTGGVDVSLEQLRSGVSVSSNSSVFCGSVLLEEERNLHGSQLFELCLRQSTGQVLERALCLLDDEQQQDGVSSCPGTALASASTALLNLGQDGLLDSVRQHCLQAFFQQQQQPGAVDQPGGWLLLKQCLLVCLLDGQIVTDSDGASIDVLAQDAEFYFTILATFVRCHVDQPADLDSEVTVQPEDERVLALLCKGAGTSRLTQCTHVLEAALTPHSRHSASANQLSSAWLRLCYWLTRLAAHLLQQRLHKRANRRMIARRFLAILVNCLVDSTVGAYLHELTLASEQQAEQHMWSWCERAVLPGAAIISDCLSWRDLLANLEPRLLALMWASLAKLSRLAAALLPADAASRRLEQCHRALDCYNQALALCGLSSPMAANLRSDRLRLSMTLLENVYEDRQADTKTLNKAIEQTEKVLRTETTTAAASASHQDDLKFKIAGLRLRLNFVRYYLNVVANKPYNYDQILGQLNSDLQLLAGQPDSPTRVQDLLLIIFYVTKIQADKAEVLSVGVVHQFAVEAATAIGTHLSANKEQWGTMAAQLQSVLACWSSVLHRLVDMSTTELLHQQTVKKKRRASQQIRLTETGVEIVKAALLVVSAGEGGVWERLMDLHNRVWPVLSNRG